MFSSKISETNNERFSIFCVCLKDFNAKEILLAVQRFQLADVLSCSATCMFPSFKKYSLKYIYSLVFDLRQPLFFRALVTSVTW